MKTVLITGASSGIGLETAKVYAREGYSLVLVARRLENLTKLQEHITSTYQVSVHIHAMDLAQTQAADALLQWVLANNHQVDVLINNAGFGLYDAFIAHDPNKLEQMMLLNIVTLTKLSQLFGKEMVKNGGGNIVNIASTAAFQPMPKLAVYAATKSYVMNFSEAIAYELKNHNIHVTCINPGATNSEFAKVANFTSEVITDTTLPSSKDLAEFIFKSMVQKKTNPIYGFKNTLMALSNRWVSRKLATRIAAKMIE